MNMFGAGIAGCVIGSSVSFFVNRYTKKDGKEYSLPEKSFSYCVLNLTPHTVKLYDDSENLLFGFKPEDKDMQLRLVMSNKTSEKSDMFSFGTFNYEYHFSKKNESYLEDRKIMLWNDGLGKFVTGFLPVKAPVVYDKIEGIEKLREHLKKYRDNSIIVSMMVAEFMMEHKNDYSDLDVRILVPDPDPKNSVHDDKGMILGVKGFIDYGKLTK
jgi:hypothetical protein